MYEGLSNCNMQLADVKAVIVFGFPLVWLGTPCPVSCCLKILQNQILLDQCAKKDLGDGNFHLHTNKKSVVFLPRVKKHPEGTMTHTLELTVNGSVYLLQCPANRSLLDVLRDELGLKATKYGCGKGQCGACTVLVDGRPARSCMLRANRAAGREITTLEGLADPETGDLSSVQQGFFDCEGAQCGYCLSGMVMTALALLSDNPDPSRDEIRDALRHNLCRCGTHLEIIASVERAAMLMRGISV